eukprot:1211996-Amphidinium_carterae.1
MRAQVNSFRKARSSGPRILASHSPKKELVSTTQPLQAGWTFNCSQEGGEGGEGNGPGDGQGPDADGNSSSNATGVVTTTGAAR